MPTQLSDAPDGSPMAPVAAWIDGRRRSILRELVALAARPGILSMAGGCPAPELFPRHEYAAAIQRTLRDATSLQYQPPCDELKRRIVELMAVRGVDCSPDQVFLTTGAQQGIDILARLFLNPGQAVVLESVTYTGVQQAIGPLHPHVLTVPTDLETGLDVDALQEHLLREERPAFLYVISDAHNPYGVSLSPEKRRQLVELATRFRLPIVEDDPYGFLHYRDTTPKRGGEVEPSFAPPLRALDSEWVFYLGSFSKILAPALRLGWMILPTELVPQVTIIKEASDLETSALTQRAVATYLQEANFPAHLERLRTEYGRRRNAMLQSLDRWFPRTARWTRPSGGLFVWVELAPEVNTWDLLETAIREQGVAFVPGVAFAVNETDGNNCLRLSFASCSCEKISDAVRRLAKVIERRPQ